MSPNRLAIYLNDHLAAAVGATELARRSAHSNRGTRLGQELERLVEELDEDRAALRALMAEAGVRVDPVKTTGAWLAEKVGRLKLNGHLISYSPLSRLEELECLVLGVRGKLLLWRTLDRVGNGAGESVDLHTLSHRASAQLRRLERWRIAAAREAL